MPPTPRKRTAAKAETVQPPVADNRVDETVRNQESLGSGNVVDRNPDPQLVQDPFSGATYDVSKSSPELVDPDAEENEIRKNKLRQEGGVLNAKDFESDEQDETPKIKLEFLESGLTAGGRVYKKGETLELEDTESARKTHEDLDGNVWYELSANEQKTRYGKVFFEKR